ncbi:MAG: amidohydrolase family protein [Kiritimatiellae bacterium]|nr:amidohydrolase family protein [Kiritimatiellia bacterium]
MIVDVHVHSLPRTDRDILPMMREECRRNGVLLCLLSSLGKDNWPRFPTTKDISMANQTACSLAENSKGLLRWYVYINPQNSNWRKELDKCVAQGAIGIKLWLSLKDKHGKLTNTKKVLQYAACLKKPVLIHTFNRTDESLPGEINIAEFMELARRHPRAKMIAAHAGIHWPSETGLFQRLPNVWVDICGGYPLKGQVEALVREIGADRILFGSDFMGRSQASQVAKVMLSDISEEQKENIFYRNAASLFGLNITPQKHFVPELYNCPVDATEDHFCFCGQWPFFKSASSTPKELHSLLVKTGIKRAYVADLGGIYRQDLGAANAAFLKAVREFERIKPLAIINPQVANWQSVLESMSPEFAGIILFPFLHGWSLADARYKNLFRWCRQHEIRVWINCSMDDARFRHPGTVSRAVSAEDLLSYGALAKTSTTVFQGVSRDVMDAFLKRHSRDKRFSFEISRLTDASGALRNMLKKYGKGRLVMGSEYPFRDMAQVRWTSQRV